MEQFVYHMIAVLVNHRFDALCVIHKFHCFCNEFIIYCNAEIKKILPLVKWQCLKLFLAMKQLYSRFFHLNLIWCPKHFDLQPLFRRINWKNVIYFVFCISKIGKFTPMWLIYASSHREIFNYYNSLQRFKLDWNVNTFWQLTETQVNVEWLSKSVILFENFY